MRSLEDQIQRLKLQTYGADALAAISAIFAGCSERVAWAPVQEFGMFAFGSVSACGYGYRLWAQRDVEVKMKEQAALELQREVEKRVKERSETALGFDSALKLLHGLALQSKKVSIDPRLRLCLFVRDKNKKGMLRRITSMVGGDAGGLDDELREISVKTGLVGDVALKGIPKATKMDKGISFYEFMTEWRFEPEEISGVHSDRRSWYGVPLGAKGSPALGVLMCDSSDPEFFGEDERSHRRTVLRRGVVPLAGMLRENYSTLFS